MKKAISERTHAREVGSQSREAKNARCKQRNAARRAVKRHEAEARQREFDAFLDVSVSRREAYENEKAARKEDRKKIRKTQRYKKAYGGR